jgi:hypothetical protein
MPAQITLPIAGADYPNRKRGPSRRDLIAQLVPGDPVTLRPEPANPADPHAIAVLDRAERQLGYIPAERAPWIGTCMRRGAVAAIFQGHSPRSGFIRLAFGGDTPALPAKADTPPPPAEWWPDPEGPQMGA